MSIATSRGFVVGNTYYMSMDDLSYSGFLKGDAVLLERDDDTSIPYFRRTSDGKRGFVPLHCVNNVVGTEALSFEVKEVKVVETVIRINRELTQAEREAIQELIFKGA